MADVKIEKQTKEQRSKKDFLNKNLQSAISQLTS
jgi:hypothetical protein